MKVRSFDLFDTLIARFCVEPRNIFEEVARRTGISDFGELRIRAEHTLAGHEYSLDAIYREVQLALQCPPEATDVIRDTELEVELENLFPIKEMVDKICPGDIIVTDIYLPKLFIFKIVREILSLPHNPIFVSSYGKSAGWIWPSIQMNLDIEEHFGDNVMSDIETPKKYSIRTSLVKISQRSKVETFLADAGYVMLSNVIRKSRLTSYNASPIARSAQLLQYQVNFPLLFFGTARLAKLIRELQVTNVLMSARDCYLWFGMASRLLKIKQINLTYFYTSRISRYRMSHAYREYVTALCKGKKSLVVDICGSGHSLQAMAAGLHDISLDIFLYHRLTLKQLTSIAERWPKPLRQLALHSVLFDDDSFSNFFEHANNADHEMVLDVARVRDEFCPIFAARTSTEKAPEIFGVQHQAFRLAQEFLLEEKWQGEFAAAVESDIDSVVRSLYQGLNDHLDVYALLDDRQKRDEASVWQMMQSEPARPTA